VELCVRLLETGLQENLIKVKSTHLRHSFSPYPHLRRDHYVVGVCFYRTGISIARVYLTIMRQVHEYRVWLPHLLLLQSYGK